MRRRLAYALIWAAVTAVAAGGSWLGLRSALDAGGPQRAPHGTAESAAPAGTWVRASGGPAGAVRRTFLLVGGTVTVQAAPSGVTVVTLRAAAGFRSAAPVERGVLRLVLQSPRHASRLTVQWRGDGPYAEVTESV